MGHQAAANADLHILYTSLPLALEGTAEQTQKYWSGVHENCETCSLSNRHGWSCACMPLAVRNFAVRHRALVSVPKMLDLVVYAAIAASVMAALCAGRFAVYFWRYRQRGQGKRAK